MGITSRDRACEMVETYKEGKKKNIYVQTEFIEIYIIYMLLYVAKIQNRTSRYDDKDDIIPFRRLAQQEQRPRRTGITDE